MDEIDEVSLVGERWLDFVAPATSENEAGLSAVDADFLDIGIGKVLRERAKRCDRCKYLRQKPRRLLAFDRRHGSSPLLLDQASYELIDPGLVVNPDTCAVAPRELSRELGLDAHTDVRLDHRAIGHGYRSADTAEPAAG